MNDAPTLTWAEGNQRYLMDALARVRGYVERKGAGPPEPNPAAAAVMSGPPAIEAIAAGFNLSPFERDVLLLCAGVELDSALAAACAVAQGDGDQRYPTFALALSVLPDAHWSALSPAGPLRRFRLIELGGGNTLTGSPLRIDERVLHHIAGESHMDERLAGLVEPVSLLAGSACSVPSGDCFAHRRRLAADLTLGRIADHAALGSGRRWQARHCRVGVRRDRRDALRARAADRSR